MPPIEPPPTPWRLPETSRLDDSDDDLVAVGADLEPGTLLAAYRRGMFPMPTGHAGDPPCWFSPVERGVLPLAPGPRGGLRVSRSLRRSLRDVEVRVDTAVGEVIDACGDPRRPHGWIDDDVRAAYLRLHELGWVHSVEAWQGGALVGGLYGVCVGGLFAGESMFHRVPDASKAALVGLVDLLLDGTDPATRGDRLLDVQWSTPHLASLGVVEVPRADYLARLPRALALPPPPAFDR